MSAALAGFYVGSAFFSDFGALYYYRILDVRADGQGSIVRYIRVAPVEVNCPRTIVQAVEARVPGKSPSDLVGGANPCAVTQRSIRRALGPRGKIGHLESITFDIVAECGSAGRSLSLPDADEPDLKRIENETPGIAGLWKLMTHVIRPIFGETDLFTDRSDEDGLALQHFGEALIPDLVSGKYDRGLKGALDGRFTFRGLLSDYRGPITSAQVKAGLTPKLLNAEAYRFRKYQAAAYQLAKQARIQGRVQLELDHRRKCRSRSRGEAGRRSSAIGAGGVGRGEELVV